MLKSPSENMVKGISISEYLSQKKVLIDDVIVKLIPREFDLENLTELLGKARYEFSPEFATQVISKPMWEFLGRGGKRWRPALFFLITEALGKKSEDVVEFAAIPELIHNGSIIIDDIEDDSTLRRGKPALHKIFGRDVAINVGNALYFIPLVTLLKQKNYPDKIILKAFKIYLEEMINLHFGQGMDIYWHKGGALEITEKEYLRMCALKTGTLARLAARLAVVLALGTQEQEKALSRMAETIGIAFQIRDDILDVEVKDRKKFGKAFGNDITEGKRSFLVVHTLQVASDRDRERLLEILNTHTKDVKLIEEAIEILRKYDSPSYAKNFARKLVQDSWRDVELLLSESEAREILSSFVEYLVEREI